MRHPSPGAGIVLRQTADEGERLSERKTLTMLDLLLIAGNETTNNPIGNVILAQLRDPHQMPAAPG